MDRLDISKFVDALINGAAPERHPELSSVLGEHEGRVHLTNQPGFDIGVLFGIVQITECTLRQIWLLGFASWRAIQAYSGVLWLLNHDGLPFCRDEVAECDGQAKADAAFDDLISQAQKLRDLDEDEWPRDVPLPENHGTLSDAQDIAAYDLVCISAAYIFLHEFQHARFSDEDRPDDPIEEERACDRFAQEYLLGKVADYAKQTGEPAEKVLGKRALGIAVAKFLILEVTPDDRWPESETHPSVGERVALFLQSLNTELDENFWIGVGSFLAAICRTRNLLPEKIEFSGPRELVFELAEQI